jgi:hypothetical protein
MFPLLPRSEMRASVPLTSVQLHCRQGRQRGRPQLSMHSVFDGESFPEDDGEGMGDAVPPDPWDLSLFVCSSKCRIHGGQCRPGRRRCCGGLGSGVRLVSGVARCRNKGRVSRFRFREGPTIGPTGTVFCVPTPHAFGQPCCDASLRIGPIFRCLGQRNPRIV